MSTFLCFVKESARDLKTAWGSMCCTRRAHACKVQPGVQWSVLCLKLRTDIETCQDRMKRISFHLGHMAWEMGRIWLHLQMSLAALVDIVLQLVNFPVYLVTSLLEHGVRHSRLCRWTVGVLLSLLLLMAGRRTWRQLVQG